MRLTSAGLAAALALGGCATTGSSTTTATATAQHFTGRPYDIKDEGNRVTGLVCGVPVDYTVRREAGTTVLTGFSDNGRPLDLRVARDGDGRRIVGALGLRTGANEVDLKVDDAAIAGQSGIRKFDLRANGDGYGGKVTSYALIGAVYGQVDGRGELQRMPDEAVAAVLPTLLNCDSPMRAAVHPQLAVRFGGPPGYETRQANQIH